ncbi:laccase-14-like [Nymphaea colorata]|nr:laccase-14-like [Nymphaea colorata]
MGMDLHKALQLLPLFTCFLSCSLPWQAFCTTHFHDFVVAPTSFTRLCEAREVLAINGQLPGPTLYVQRGDNLFVNVHNHAPYPITIHWHGLLNPRNPWFDGPEYITMCGVPPGSNFTHQFHFTTEEGTIWYHAHSDWTRWSVYGAVVVYPRLGTTYPFPNPYKEYVVILGEWWSANVMDMYQEKISTGADFNKSDAYMINGQPGDRYECSESETTRFLFQQGKTYLIRLVNGAMTNALFFAIANHTLRIVGRDGSYLKPFDSESAVISPGQTMDIIVHANQPKGLYYIASSAYIVDDALKLSNNITTAIVEYDGFNTSQTTPSFPYLPSINDMHASYEFSKRERSLASEDHPVDVPLDIDRRLFLTLSINLGLCPNNSCGNINGTRSASSVNNISFVSPSIDILEAYYGNIKNVYTTDFPSFPPVLFNFTSDDYPSEFYYPEMGTKVLTLNYNESIELVFQATSILRSDAHPMHLHGYDFYVVGRGYGNFDPEKDPLNYNLVDPPLENTIAVPYLGWSALRFRANNPGVWLLHCHFERHFTWGMTAIFIVKDGPTNETSMVPPPSYMPKCSDKIIGPGTTYDTLDPFDK